MDQIALIPFTQLINPITTPDQNQSQRNRHEPTEYLEAFRQWRRAWRHALPFSVSPDVFACQSDEDGDDDDLEGETCDRDVNGGIAAAFGGG